MRTDLTKSRANLDAAYRRLDRLYRQVPELSCRGRCQESCGPTHYSALEARRIEEATGRPPPHVPGYNENQSDMSMAVLEAHKHRGAFRCNFLDETGVCTCYAIRPMICRLWGLVNADHRRCPHGCKPRKWLTNAQAKRLLRKTVQLSMEVLRENRPGSGSNGDNGDVTC